MKKERDQILARLADYPTPLARAYWRCLTAADPSVRHRAGRDWARGAMAVMTGLAAGILRGLKRKLPGAQPLQPGDWATAKALRRLWAEVGPVLAAEKTPGPDLTLARRREASAWLAGLAEDFFGLLEELAELKSCPGGLRPEAGGEVADPGRPVYKDRDLGLLLDGPLAFLRHWAMVAVTEVNKNLEGQVVFGTELTGTGPLPTEITLSFDAKPPDAGKVYLVHGQKLWVSLHPFVIFLPVCPPVVPAEADFGHDVFYLDSFGPARAEMRSSSYGFVIAQNNLLGEIKAAWRGLASATYPVWSRPTWGLAFIEMANTSAANIDLGYEGVDAILQAIDREGALLGAGDLDLQGGPQFFPFWYRPDLLIMPLAYDEKLHPPELVASCAEEALRHLLVRAQEAAAPEGLSPIFYLAIDLVACGGKGKGGTGQFEIAFLKEVESAREAVRHVHAKAPEAEALGQVWIRRMHRSSGFAYRVEGAYTRISQASFALIARTRAGDSEFLLRFNPRHQTFNFVGGHLEDMDHGDPEATLIREIREELGLAEGDYRFSRFLPEPLRTIEFSKPYGAWTYYVHHFFRVDICEGLKPGLGESPQELVWASLAELDTGRLKDGRPISRFPFRLMAPFLPALASGEPFMTAQVNDCGWRRLPSADRELEKTDSGRDAN